MLEKSIRLVSVDDLDLDLLTDADYHPIPISMLDIKFDFLKCVTKRIRSKTNNKYYRALPLYVNLPVLLCEKTAENRVIKSGKPIKSWEGLANWLDLEDNDSDDNVPAFEFSKGVAENYNCMFLEILHSLVSEEQGGIKSENFASTFLNYLDKDIGNKAAFLFWRLCHKAHCLSKPHKDEFSKKDQKKNKPKPDALEILQINPSFSFCRTWFTSVYDVFERNKDSYNIKTLPGTGAVLGTWYLTVPKSSPAPDIAKKLCVALCDRDRSIERFESWIGIPPYSSLCGRKPKITLLDYKAEESTINFARKYLSEIAESAIVRTEIPQYTTFSNLLSFYLQRILEIKKTDHENVPKSDIEAELNAAIKAIKRI